MSTNDPIVIDGVEINLPISILKDKEPVVYDVLAGTEADSILSKSHYQCRLYFRTAND